MTRHVVHILAQYLLFHGSLHLAFLQLGLVQLGLQLNLFIELLQVLLPRLVLLGQQL